MTNKAKITHLAYTSRVILIILQYISNQLIPDHDAKVFIYPQPNKTKIHEITDHFLGGFVRWDAQYFMHIAKYGYTYENSLAFFPLFPVTVGFLGDFIGDIVGKGYMDPILLVLFIGVNVYLFGKSAICLYELTESLLGKSMAYRSAVLFCFNPASVFFVAPYTECLFSYLTFLGMLNCVTLYDKYVKPNNVFVYKDLCYVLPIALSTITRSNGVLNIGFLLYTFICLYRRTVKVKKVNSLWSVLTYLFVIFMTTIDCLLPFIVYQYYCYRTFCHNFPVNLPPEVVQLSKKKHYILPGSYDPHGQTWCNSPLPLAYSYVQDHYWNVGFLRYYELKQTPNFLLALPILSLVIYHSLKHVFINFNRNSPIFTLENPHKSKQLYYLYQPRLTVFYLHSLFLAVFCLLCIHVQVSTRLICSATPVFYWVCSNEEFFKLPSYKDGWKVLFFRTYFFGYFVAGTVLFCNFLPWT